MIKFVRVFVLTPVLSAALTTVLTTVALAVMVLPSSAQGLQTGVLTGTARDQSMLPLPGVTVAATSTALQGTRATVTDENGVYSLPGLPPGTYAVRFELAGMRSVDATQRVDLGRTAKVDAVLQVSLVESVRVDAPAPSIVTSTQGGANLRVEDVNKLANIRTVWGIAELAPGLTDNTPTAGQLTVSGGFAYSTQFLINGVDVADNIFGTSNNLFIEDALQEVQVLTSGISAEYGRFGGGVVNAITKSGGNVFSGSGRLNFYSPSWTRETPFEEAATVTRPKDVQNNYEWTLGGPVRKDRLWFFTAGRWQKASTPAPLPETAIPFTTETTNKRAEAKLTGTVAANHTLQGSFTTNSTQSRQAPVSGTIDPLAMVNRSNPNTLWVTSYRGILGGRTLATLQVSGRHFGTRNGGGTETDILRSPFRTRGVTAGVPASRFYNAPYLDSTDPENRDNRQATGALNWLLTSGGAGSHDVKVGFENFVNRYVGGNSQSATGYVFRADYATAGGRPLLDADGRIVPVFAPGVTRIENWLPLRGSKLEITTNSVYAHDRWTAGPRLTLDLGTRFEMVGSQATGDIQTVDARTIVPRLGAAYDLTGTGRWVAQATYGHYSAGYVVPQFLGAAEVGNPSLVIRTYTGPAGQGVDFAPGFDPANYTVLVNGNFPTANVSYADGIRSPLTREFTVGLGTPFGDRGAAKVLYQWRSMGNFVEDFVNDPSAAGKVLVSRNGVTLGTFDRLTYRNTDAAVRDYQALVFQGNRRLSSRWTVDGHWTVQLRNYGNFEGEAAGQPGIATAIGNYPEMAVIDRSEPLGRLNDFQRNKLRVWSTYNLDFARFGALDASVLYRYNSALTYSLVANGVATTAAQRALDPGYATPLAAQSVYFGERGSEQFDSTQMVDLALTYSVPVFKQWRPWVKAEVFNLFNDQSLVTYNTAVTPRPGGALDANGLPLEYVRGAAFGTATAITSFPRSSQNFAGQNLYARTFLLSAGFRF